ncbi:MAG TPA: hypothetical protein PLU24_04095 [Candidatus Omnitrophota bacterium]|nr:hypothetical protein [Candidatus Omnitrophota bacterium]
MPKQGIFIFGIAEIAIGITTLLSIFFGFLTQGYSKPANVLAFVIISSLISAGLGAGVLLRLKYARKLLIFFSGWVILSKILIFMRIIILCCALETMIPEGLKNYVSILYHLIVIFYFHHPSIKAEFEK